MSNFFKRFEATKKTKPEEEGPASLEEGKVPETGPEELPLEDESAPEKKETVGDVLDKLRQVMLIKQEMGSSIKLEEVEQLTGMSLVDFGEFLSGEKISIETNGGRLMETLQSAMEATEDQMKEGILKKFAKNKSVRVAFVTLMLLLKLAPASQGAETPAKDKLDNKTEKSFDQQNNIEPDNTYHSSPEDFNDGDKKGDAKPLEVNVIESGRNSHFDLAIGFDTDSDNIDEKSQEQIATNFEKFLGQITPKNVDDVLKAEPVVYGSSDERITMDEKWQGQNAILTEARLVSAESILQKVLQNFSFDGISEDKVEALRAMDFSHEMPHSQTGAEEGVDYITDRVNPDSPDGYNYSVEEVADMKINNPDKYKQLLDDGRKIVFKLILDNSQDIAKMEPRKANLEKPETNIELIPTPPAIERMSDYQNVTLAFDNSPSVSNSGYMTKVLEGQNFNKVKIDFTVFSDKIGSIKSYSNAQEVIAAIDDIEYKGSVNENSISAAISIVKGMEAGQENAAFILTDENLQDASQASLMELRSLSQKNNTDVFFYCADDKKQVVNQVSLDDIEAAYQESVYKLLAPKMALEISIQENKVAALEKILVNHQSKLSDLEKLAQKGANEAYQRGYQDAQDRETELLASVEENRGSLETLRSAFEDTPFNDLFTNKVLKNIFDGKGGHIKLDSKLVCPLSVESLGKPAIHLMADSKISK